MSKVTKVSVALNKDDVIRIEQLRSMAVDMTLKAEHIALAAKLSDCIYNCAVTAKVVGEFNMWRGDTHFDEADINIWLDGNRTEADWLIRMYRGPKTAVKFLYHNEQVFITHVRGRDRQDCIEQAMNEFNVQAAPNEPLYDTIVTWPTSHTN